MPETTETCANDRRHIGSHNDPDFYRYDMDDAEWFGEPDDDDYED